MARHSFGGGKRLISGHIHPITGEPMHQESFPGDKRAAILKTPAAELKDAYAALNELKTRPSTGGKKFDAIGGRAFNARNSEDPGVVNSFETARKQQVASGKGRAHMNEQIRQHASGGGKGRGNWGHKGRKGIRGGSA